MEFLQRDQYVESHRMEKGTSSKVECNSVESEEAERNIREATITSPSTRKYF